MTFSPRSHECTRTPMTSTAPSSVSCPHSNCFDDGGMRVCVDCGVEVSKEVPATRDNAHLFDLQRCSFISHTENTLTRELYRITELTHHERELSEEIYNTCAPKSSDTSRRHRRDDVLIASVYYACKILKHPRSCEDLIKMFNTTRRRALKGIKFVNSVIPKELIVRAQQISPMDIIGEMLRHFHISDQKVVYIQQICQSIYRESPLFLRSRPQSVAAGVIWFWVVNFSPASISIEEFTEKIGMSELTIQKIARDIRRLHPSLLRIPPPMNTTRIRLSDTPPPPPEPAHRTFPPQKIHRSGFHSLPRTHLSRLGNQGKNFLQP